MEKKINILIIEDVPADAELVEHELRKEKIEFSSKRVDTKKDFLRELKDFVPDIIISDFCLPQFNGMAALELAKGLAPLTPFIICTGSMNEETAVECMKAGAADYVIKEHLVRIVPAVKNALEQKQIREKKEQAEKALMLSALEWQTTFNAIKDGICLTDLNGKLIRCNKAMTKLLGKPASKILGYTLNELIKNISKPAKRDLISSAKKTKRRETQILKINGRWFNISVDPIFDKDGNFLGAVQIISDITEHKLADEKIENLARFPSENPFPVLRVKKDGTILYANEASMPLLKKWGCEVGRSLTDQLHRLIMNVFKTSESETTEVDCEDKIFSFVIAPVIKAGYVNLYGNDITERKKTEEALRASEERFALAVHGTNDGIWDWDIQNNSIYWSPRMKKLLGYTDDELEVDYNTFLSHLHPDDIELTKKAIEAHLKDRVTFNIEQRLRTKSGDYRWFHVRGEAVRDENGNPIRIVGASTDITGRRKVDEELRKLSVAVEQNPVNIVITDSEGKIEYVNHSFTETTGCTCKEVIGAYSLIKSKEYPPELHKEIWDTIKPGKVWKGEIYSRTKNGEPLWQYVSIGPIKNERGEITNFLIIKEDITGRKNLEEQFLHAQKMEAIGRFAGGIAHDFNNMMTAVIGFSDYLISHLKEGDATRSIIKQIKNAGTRAASLTKQLLTFSREQVIQIQFIDLNNVIKDIKQMLKQLLGEDIDLLTALNTRFAMVKADKSQIEQIIMNLAVNARDAMPDGGKLIIETSKIELDEDYCTQWIDIQPGKYLMLSVSDNGCGIDKETQQHIFEPFFTTKEIGDGTGLGLSTVYGIVKQNNGYIHVYSELEKGTTFKIYFPYTIEESKTDTEGTEEISKESLKGSETVLVAEDEELVRQIIANTLNDNGYKVIEASNGKEALTICGKYEGKIHLLITDVIMPGIQGPSLAKKILSMCPEISVLFISGYTNGAAEKLELLEYENYFLEKPFTPNKLLSKIREILQKA